MLATSMRGLSLHAGSAKAARAGGALPAARAPLPAARPGAGMLTVEAAHKKGAGHSKNGRDSVSKRRGIKVFGGQPVKAGGIIVRQLGTNFHPGALVGRGKDDTLFALQEGIVVFRLSKHTREVSVVPTDEYVTPEGQVRAEVSRRTKRCERFPPRAAAREAAAAIAVVAARTAP